MIKNLVWNILINTVVLLIIARFIPIGGLTIEPISWNMTPILLAMGAIFWVMFSLCKPILKLLMTPINFLTLGIASVLLTIGMMYLFVYIVNSLALGLTMKLGTIEQTFILSVIITILSLLLKKIL